MTINKQAELYFHIPFCVRKCLYCDFLSAPAEKAVQDAYMEALLKEAAGRSGELGGYKIVSAFLGGGTPSVVDEKWIQRLMDTIRRCFDLAENAEVTIEVNPGTVNREKLLSYSRAGINRLSIGLQSADPGELRALGRIHTYEQFLETYESARDTGFQNINVDIMSALPGQTLESYRNSLNKILKLQPVPEHISAYSLIVEENTPFALAASQGRLALPEEDCEREMYEDTLRILRGHGYHRYEISNYALDGRECLHNCGYWQRVSYAGFGIGAASLLKNIRYSNSSDMESYIRDPMGARLEGQVLDRQEQMEEFLFLGLRLVKGVSRKQFQDTFGCELEEIYGPVIERNLKDGLLKQQGDALWLTQRGMDVSNYVFAQFL